MKLMAMSHHPNYAAPVVQEFLERVKTHSIDGTDGRLSTPRCPFMPLPDLRDYLKAENRTTKILHALCIEHEHPVDIEVLERESIRVFTILILIGKGTYIEHFLAHQNLRDSHLPFLEKPLHFPVDPHEPNFWDSFYEKQFTFCPHYFQYQEAKLLLDDRHILPIVSKDEISKGGSAVIYKIRIHPHYDRLHPDQESFRPPNTYVLKTYNTKAAHSYYENEVDAFKKLTKRNGIDENLVQFLGSYKQGDTYNILLEYADHGTLEDFFQEVIPPSLPQDIILFWRRLFNISGALQRIHTTERPDDFRGSHFLIGWHQDVQPKNILVFSGKSDGRYDVHFKLGDLGLSHFKRTVKLDRTTLDSDVGGTKDYGAPECFRDDAFLDQSRLDVRPSIDIWSLGGIYSEASVYIVVGKSGLIEYRDQRAHEILERKTSQDGSCFHDGEKVLTSVQRMHERLLVQGETRPGDFVTKSVLAQIIPCLLDDNPDTRQDALWLWKNSQKILEEAETKQQESRQLKTSRELNSEGNGAHNAIQAYRGNCHAHGPPPNHPHCRRSGVNARVSMTTREARPSIPCLSFNDAKEIRDRREALPIELRGLLYDLKKRDHVFLMDDSCTMKPHWDKAIGLFEVLAYHIKELDSNALKMYFTVSSKKKSFRHTRTVVSQLRCWPLSSYSNMNARLQKILGKYQAALDPDQRKPFARLRPDVKPLSLYIFTDGAWPGCDAVAPIRSMVEKLRRLGLPKEQIGIQFIRFGNNPEAIAILEFLDSGLRKEHTQRWDIVDTEPCEGGNLLKMLLGSTSNWFDDDMD